MYFMLTSIFYIQPRVFLKKNLWPIIALCFLIYFFNNSLLTHVILKIKSVSKNLDDVTFQLGFKFRLYHVSIKPMQSKRSRHYSTTTCHRKSATLPRRRRPKPRGHGLPSRSRLSTSSVDFEWLFTN